MRAILINPQDQTITEVDYTGDYKNICTHIGADCFDIARFGDKDNHAVFVDDEGLINGAVDRVGMFRLHGENPVYLAGKGLILAHNAAGESIAATMTLDALRTVLTFGKPVRINDAVYFLELHPGEVASIATLIRNKRWRLDN